MCLCYRVCERWQAEINSLETLVKPELLTWNTGEQVEVMAERQWFSPHVLQNRTCKTNTERHSLLFMLIKTKHHDSADCNGENLPFTSIHHIHPTFSHSFSELDLNEFSLLTYHWLPLTKFTLNHLHSFNSRFSITFFIHLHELNLKIIFLLTFKKNQILFNSN